MLVNEMSNLNQQIARWEGRLEGHTLNLQQARGGVEFYGQEVEHIVSALDRLKELEEAWRENFRRTLEAVVSQGLSAVFEEPISILLQTTEFRDVTNVEMWVQQGGITTPIAEAKGGTLIQILGVLLEVLLTISVQPPLAPIVILDEPFGMVSAEYRASVSALIAQLHEQLGLQLLIITHEPEYLDCAQLAYEVYLEDNEARLRVLEQGVRDG